MDKRLKYLKGNQEPLADEETEKIEELVEALFADGTTYTTFIRKKDSKEGVEECYIIMKSEWQALKEGK